MVGKKEYAQINELLNARLDAKKVLIAVHRGAWGGNIIEGTVPSLELALKMGADMFECDLSKSTDGVIYAFHDTQEPRLLKTKQNVKTMTSAEIDALEFYNSIDEPSGKHVQRFEEVVKYFTHGELFNIDRSWSILAETHELLKDYPHVVHDGHIHILDRAVLEELQIFVLYRGLDDRLLDHMEELRKVLTYDNINIVGVEAIAKTADSEMIDPDNLKWIREQGLYIWVNSINLGRGHELSGTYNDDVALSEGPDAAWGVLMDRGYNVIQTDWPSLLASYRDEKFGV